MSRLLMTLHQGEVQQVNRRNLGDFRSLSFVEYKIAVATSGFNFNRTDPSSFGRSDRTMNIAQMRAIADTAEIRSAESGQRFDSLFALLFVRDTTGVSDSTARARTPKEAASAALARLMSLRSQIESAVTIRDEELRRSDQYWVEIHKKYSIPAACLVFVFVGAPLGIVVRRGNFGVSASIALGFFIIYWACLVAGEKLADRAFLSPAVAMWMADGIIGALGVYLTILVSRETVTFNFDFAWLRRLTGRKNKGVPGTPNRAA
jgi:lipopolysaccharide export system permease protein